MMFLYMENFYNEESRICSYNLTFFVKNGEKYNRVDEYQEQKAYLQDEIEDLIKRGAFAVGCFDGLSFNKSSEKAKD